MKIVLEIDGKKWKEKLNVSPYELVPVCFGSDGVQEYINDHLTKNRQKYCNRFRIYPTDGCTRSITLTGMCYCYQIMGWKFNIGNVSKDGWQTVGSAKLIINWTEWLKIRRYLPDPNLIHEDK